MSQARPEWGVGDALRSAFRGGDHPPGLDRTRGPPLGGVVNASANLRFQPLPCSKRGSAALPVSPRHPVSGSWEISLTEREYSARIGRCWRFDAVAWKAARSGGSSPQEVTEVLGSGDSAMAEAKREFASIEEAAASFEAELVRFGRADFSQFIPSKGDDRREPLLLRLLQIAMRYLGEKERTVALERLPAMWPEVEEDSWRSLRATLSGEGTLVADAGKGAAIPSLEIPSAAAVAAELRERMPKVAERFEVLRRLGSGSMGTVFEARDRERDETVALKVFRGADPELLVLFKREFRWLTNLTHPNLVVLYEFFHRESFAFFTMERVEGVSFRDHLVREDTAAIRPDFGDLRRGLHQLAEGIDALHREGKLHRDIKPTNILVTRDPVRVILLDFGLVTRTSEAVPFLAADPLNQNLGGTLPYMAPEQMEGGPLDGACDWYAVGVILFEVLTGERPFEGSFDELLDQKREPDLADLRDILREVPDDLAELCMGLLAPDPRDRVGYEEVVRLRGSAPPETVRAVEPAGVDFVGREAELQRLREAFESARGNGPVVARVHGDSGMGKTALVQHFLQELGRKSAPPRFCGRCYEQESSAYKGVDEVIDQLSGDLASRTEEEVQGLLPADVGCLGVVFPVLCRIDGIRQAARTAGRIADPRELRRRAFVAFRELLSRISEAGPVVTFIDDFQWCDADSIAVLDAVLDERAPASLLLLISYRREHAAEHIALERMADLLQNRTAIPVVDVPIDELPGEAAAELASGLLAASGVDSPPLAALIAEESRGNPYFLRELAGADVDDLGNARLEDLIIKRFRALPQEAQRFLEIVSVASRPVLRCDLAEAADLPGREQKMESILRAAYFIKSSGAGWKDQIETFHDRIRETIRGALDPGILRERHWSLATALECSPEIDHEALAFHFQGAEVFEKAGTYYARAAEDAAEILAFDRAAQLYRQSLRTFPRPETEQAKLRVRLGEVLALAGRGFEAGETYQLAARDSDDAARSELEWRAAFQFLVTGHLDEARVGLENLMRRVGLSMHRSALTALGEMLIRRIRLRMGGYRFRRREEDEIAGARLTEVDIVWSLALGYGFIEPIHAGNFNGRGLALALRTGEPKRIVRALALETIHVAGLGSFAWHHTEIILARAREVAGRDPSHYDRGVILLGRGARNYFCGDLVEAYRDLSESRELLQKHCPGATWEQDTACCYLMFSLILRGEFAELQATAAELIDEAEERGDLYLLTNVKCYPLASALVAADRPEEAIEIATEAIARWSQEGFQAQHFLAWIGLVEAHLYQGRLDQAWERSEGQWPELISSMLIYVQQCRVVSKFQRARCAILLAAESEGRERRRLLRIARRDQRLLGWEGRPWAKGMSLILKASLCYFEGRESRALACLNEAVAHLKENRAALQIAAIRIQAGQLTGGSDGLMLARSAKSWMTERGIVCPEKMAAIQVPLCHPQEWQCAKNDGTNHVESLE